MAMFRYEVTDRTGKMLSGVMSASSEADVRQKLTSMGYTIRLILAPPMDVSVQPRPAARSMPIPASGPTQRTTAPPTEMIVFFRQIQTMLHSGMNLYDGLMRIYVQTKQPGMRHIIETMARRVQAGDRLSQAMEEFPRAFPPHVIGVVASGEVGGFLPAVLGDIALDYEIEQRASVRWIQWTQRLLWINIIGTVFLIPAMPLIPIMMKEGLPGYLRAYGAIVMKFILPPVAVLIIAFVLIRIFLRRPEMRAVVHAIMLKIPVVGRASRERSLANFSRMLWRLQTSGILPIQAWDTASLASNNVVVGARLRGQISALRSGAKFSEAMEATKLFRDDDRRILEVGEMSGNTADILQRMAMHYEDAALHSAGRVRAYGLRFTLLAYALVIAAIAVSEVMYISNTITFVEREFEPMIWLLSPIR